MIPDSIPNVFNIFPYNYLSGIERLPSSDKKHLMFHLLSVIQKE